MPKILSIDASTEAFSVALLNGDCIIDDYKIAPRQHANLLLPTVDSVLKRGAIKLTDLDAIACHVGPGAFTGIRIGVAAAQGLAFGANLPAIPISSLYNLAQQSFEQKKDAKISLCAIDARMNEVYFAVFTRDLDGLAQIEGDESVLPPSEVNPSHWLTESNNYVLAGSGWEAYRSDFEGAGVDYHNLVSDLYPSARASLRWAEREYLAGRILSAAELQPCYLRNNVAVKKQPQTV